MSTTGTALKSGLRTLALATGLNLAMSAGAGAFVIADTGTTSGGSPGGQTRYEVSGLVQGDSFGLNWGGVSGLSGAATVSVLALSATEATVQVVLSNTSTPIGSSGDPRFTAFGLDGAFTLGGGTGGVYLDTLDTQNFPGFGVMVCATSGSNCAGGGNGGIDAGLTDTFSLVLDGAFGAVPTLTLRDFALKVQGGPNGNSFELAGAPFDDTPPGDVGQVPEPPALVALGLGLIGLGWMRRRRAV